LFASVDFSKSRVLLETKQFVEDCIRRAPGLELEYFEIVDGNTLQPVKAWDESNYIVGCITVYCGEVRLIDNIKYKG
jgi:pantoate--beta-alanine ligase